MRRLGRGHIGNERDEGEDCEGEGEGDSEGIGKGSANKGVGEGGGESESSGGESEDGGGESEEGGGLSRVAAAWVAATWVAERPAIAKASDVTTVMMMAQRPGAVDVEAARYLLRAEREGRILEEASATLKKAAWQRGQERERGGWPDRGRR